MSHVRTIHDPSSSFPLLFSPYKYLHFVDLSSSKSSLLSLSISFYNQKFKTLFLAMAEMNFEGLRELHDCANYLLDHCLLSEKGQEKCTEQVSEYCLKMLDICNISKDVMTFMRHTLQDLLVTLRESSSDVHEKISAYNRYRNKLKKEIFKSLNCLKSMKGEGGGGRVVMPIEQNLLFVSEVLKEVRRMVVLMVESLFSLGCIPWLERRWSKTSSLSSIFTIRSSTYCLDDEWDETAVQSAATRLEAAEIAIEDFEIELECIFRRLIHTRVSLLNILTN